MLINLKEGAKKIFGSEEKKFLARTRRLTEKGFLISKQVGNRTMILDSSIAKYLGESETETESLKTGQAQIKTKVFKSDRHKKQAEWLTEAFYNSNTKNKKDIAEYLDVRAETMSRYFSGTSLLNVDYANKLFKYFGYGNLDLLWGYPVVEAHSEKEASQISLKHNNSKNNSFTLEPDIVQQAILNLKTHIANSYGTSVSQVRITYVIEKTF